MGEFSKFKALTVLIILLFVFSIAAMYSNAKDEAQKKMKDNHKANIERNKDELEELNTEEKTDQNQEENSDMQIQRLSARVDSLENTVSSLNNNQQQNLKCSVRGIVSNGELVPLSVQDSINEAKMNGRDIVITCSLAQ